MNKPISAYNKIENLHERYIQASKNKEALLKIISETEIPEQVYNSNAIENSTLTLEETEKILLQMDLERFISERELFEAKNLARIMEYIEKKPCKKDLSLEFILLLHKMLLCNIREDIAGRIRCLNEYVRVGNYIAPPPSQVEELLENLLLNYKRRNNNNINKQLCS